MPTKVELIWDYMAETKFCKMQRQNKSDIELGKVLLLQ